MLKAKNVSLLSVTSVTRYGFWLFLKKLGNVPPVQVGSGGSCSAIVCFTVPKTYFLLCLHFVMISSLLFNVNSGFATKIVNFSVNHKSHCLPPLDSAYALALIEHVISGCRLRFLHFHTYDERAVFWMWSACLKFDWWLFYLVLKGFSVKP